MLAVYKGLVEVSALINAITDFNELLTEILEIARRVMAAEGSALILLNDGSSFTLPVAVVSMTQGTFGAIDYGMLQAGVMVMAVPCLILFVILQRHYVRGFMSGALRG